MVMKRKLILVGALLVFGVASCGGEGPGLAGGRDGTVDPGETPTVELDSLELLASTSQLQSDGSNTVTLTAVAKDANNQVIEDASVLFSASSGSLAVLSGTTNEQGIATAELTTGGDPTNRTIAVTATADGITDGVDISVIGSSIQIQGPASLVSNDTGNYTVTLSNSAGTGIPNQLVNVTSSSGNALSASTFTTDGNGRVIVEVTGTNAGTDTLTAAALPGANGSPTVTTSTTISVSGDNFRFTAPAANTEINLNTSRTVTVRWEQNGVAQAGQTIRFATTRGTVTPNTAVTNATGDATIQISSTTAGPAEINATNTGDTTTTLAVEFVATTPNQISLQADPGVLGPNETSTITAIVQDANNNRVKNATVEFTLTDTTGGALSTASAVTDSQGRAQTVYTASSVTSADDGVVITGSVVGTALPPADTSLTVAGRALFIVFGTGNTIVPNTEDTIYTKDYTLFVSDSSGKGVANATVNIRMLPTGYYKGTLVNNGGAFWEQTITAVCGTEDTANGTANGTLDAGEDLNGDGELTPGNIAVVSPGTLTTDADGAALFSISYPQNYAMWVVGRITASATVAGTESRKSSNFFFPASADDLAINSSPPNGVSPWGFSASCADTL